MENMYVNYQNEKLYYNVKNHYQNEKNLLHGKDLLLKSELRKIEIRNKDLYMMKNQNNTWVDTNLRNYKNKELENDFILL